MTNILASKAMLASVKISQWSARKLDKRITGEVHASHNAAADSGRYNKSLIARDSLAAIMKTANEARLYHYSVTLPWLDDGARLLPAVLFQEYAGKMRAFREAFDGASFSFIAEYPRYVADAQVRLNGLFNAADYPSGSDLRRRFGFASNILPVPDAADFRITIGDAELQRVQDEVTARTNEALESAMRDVWQRIAESVGHMAEKLRAFKPGTESGKAEGIFRGSLVSNVQDLVALLPALNLTSDTKLAAIAKTMAERLCDYSPDELRDNASARNATAAAAESILAQVSDFI